MILLEWKVQVIALIAERTFVKNKLYECVKGRKKRVIWITRACAMKTELDWSIRAAIETTLKITTAATDVLQWSLRHPS